MAILLRGALQLGLPPARLEKDQKNPFLKKEFTNFGWSLQVAILRRGALQMGLRWGSTQPSWKKVKKITVYKKILPILDGLSR